MAVAVFAALAAFAPFHLGAQTTTPAPMPVAFFGEIRARSEWDRPGGPLAADVYTYLRTRLGIRAVPAEGVPWVRANDAIVSSCAVSGSSPNKKGRASA